MKVFYISPIGATSPLLFETFTETLVANGHTVTGKLNEATVVFFDSHSGYLPYNWDILNYVLDNDLPVVYFDAFDYHGDSSKHWPLIYGVGGLAALSRYNEWAKFLYLRLIWARQTRLVYFMRKMQTNADYGSFVYPLELIQFPDHDFPLTTKEELNSRPYDACFIGAESPRRKAFIEALQKDGRLKLDIQFTTERIPHDEWLNRHRQAKFFIEADGGGLGSERPYQLMPIATMLKQGNLQLIHNDWEDMLDCVKHGIATINGVYVYDWNKLSLVLENPDRLYSIYLRGNKKLKDYFNAEYRTNYILDVLKQNNIF